MLSARILIFVASDATFIMTPQYKLFKVIVITKILNIQSLHRAARDRFGDGLAERGGRVEADPRESIRGEIDGHSAVRGDDGVVLGVDKDQRRNAPVAIRLVHHA